MAELCARAVVSPIGINCSEEKTIIIVTKPKKDRKAMFFQLLTWNKSDFLATKAKINKMGNEYTNLENKVIIKSTSPDKDLIIMWVNRDKNINMIQMREPIIFDDILDQIIKWTWKKYIKE